MKKFFVLVFVLSSINCTLAALGDSIILHGVTSDHFISNGYISIKDNFKQVRIYPKSWLEKMTNTKISSREVQAIFLEIPIKDLNRIHDECVKVFKAEPKSIKLCPAKI